MKLRLWALGILCAGLSLSGCGGSGGDVATSGAPVARSDEVVAPPASRALDDRLLVAGDQATTFNVLDNDEHNGGKVTEFGAGVVTQAVRAQSAGTPVVGEAGGQATLAEDGLLSYTPPPGDQPFTETYTYTVANSSGSATATLTAQRRTTYYVRHNAPPGGDGTSSAKAFNELRPALDAMGDRPGLIQIDPGDFTLLVVDSPVVLQAGQAIQGSGDSQNPPPVMGRFQVASTDCVLSNLHIVGQGDGPLIALGNNSFFNNKQPPLILRNLLLDGNQGDGIVLVQPLETELTNVTMLDINRSTGTAALLLQSPFGDLHVNGLEIQRNNVGGIVLKSEEDVPLAPGQNVKVELLGTRMQTVRNPLAIEAPKGKLDIKLTADPKLFSDFQGTMFSAAVSQSAHLDFRMENVNMAGVGDNTTVMDWTYSGTSTGVVRIGSTIPDRINVEQTRNQLNFVTRDQAQAALVCKGAKFSNKEAVNVDAYDTSIAKLRFESYLWKDGGFLEVYRHFDVHIRAHDQSLISSFVKDRGSFIDFDRGRPNNPSIAGFFYYECAVEADQTVEEADNLDDNNEHGAFNFQGFRVVNNNQVEPFDLRYIPSNANIAGIAGGKGNIPLY